MHVDPFSKLCHCPAGVPKEKALWRLLSIVRQEFPGQQEEGCGIQAIHRCVLLLKGKEHRKNYNHH